MLTILTTLFAVKSLVRHRLARYELESPVDESLFIKKHESYITVHDRRYRIVHKRHALGSKVPVMFFIHGLGGQIAQFDAQLSHFSQTANVLAVDLLGHGKSSAPSEEINLGSFQLSSIASDLVDIFLQLHNAPKSCSESDDPMKGPSTRVVPKCILIGHSLGAAVVVLMYPKIKICVEAIVLIGARYSIPRTWTYLILANIPTIVLDLMRLFDRRRGIFSPSVSRYLYRHASVEVRRRQMSIGYASKSLTLKCILWGCWSSIGGYPSREHWQQIECPVLLLSGEDEKIHSPVDHIVPICKSVKNSRAVVIPETGHNCFMENSGYVNAIIRQFLVQQVGLLELDPSVQLTKQYDPLLKWDMKNEAKWKRASCVSQIVGTSFFRGMKVMREGDDQHCPSKFKQLYPDVGLVIDISHGKPPYQTEQVPYQKVATISKVPPTPADVTAFIQVVNEFRKNNQQSTVAVHCHYGFNRTGFVICCYLIQELGVSVQAALDMWSIARSPGIKHGHFKDELFLRYSK